MNIREAAEEIEDNNYRKCMNDDPEKAKFCVDFNRCNVCSDLREEEITRITEEIDKVALCQCLSIETVFIGEVELCFHCAKRKYHDIVELKEDT